MVSRRHGDGRQQADITSDVAEASEIECSHGKRDDLMVTEFHVIGRHADHATMSQAPIDADWTHEVSS